MSKSTHLLTLDDYEREAIPRLSKPVADYFRTGADDQVTLAENRRAFSRLLIRPRFLQDVSARSIETTLLGQTVNMPVCIAPSAMQCCAHPDGEAATARAAAAAGVLMTLSTLSTVRCEDVAACAPGGLRWFQLYVYKDREFTRKLVARAEQAGYRALVVTVDTPQLGNRLDDVRNGFQLPSHIKLGHFESEDSPYAKAAGLIQAGGSSVSQFHSSQYDPSLSWEDFDWFKSITSLPIVLKGILTAEDALLAVQHGASGILVSNHGGRQLDGAPATIEALPEVVQAVRGSGVEVYLDSGVRRGTDVLKALALGARAVFIGRPVLWGLAVGGESGVAEVLRILRQELDLAMALSGCASIADVSNLSVIHQSAYCRSKL